jgi:hypothetical protein
MSSGDNRQYYEVQPLQGFTVEWEQDGEGFGLITFYYDQDGVLKFNAGDRSAEFVKQMLVKMVDCAIIGP